MHRLKMSAYRMTRSTATPVDRLRSALRWINLCFTEQDPAKFDPEEWLGLIDRCQATGGSFSAGGFVAFYPTRIPLHHRARDLGERDPFGTLVRGCRERGMAVTARVDHHALFEDQVQAHPEWVFRWPDGSPRRHESAGHLYRSCTMGSFNRDFMTQVMVEVASMYDIDGFNHNRWAGDGICWCESCRSDFRAFCGKELPVPGETNHSSLPDYQRWREGRLLELWDHWTKAVQSVRPGVVLLPAVAHQHQIDLAHVRKRACLLFHDHQSRIGYSPPYLSGLGGKEIRAGIGDKPVGLVFSVGLEGLLRWKDSVSSEAEVRMWAASALANGMVLRASKFGGVIYDRRWMGWLERMYRRYARGEAYLRNQRSLARVAMVMSPQTQQRRMSLAGAPPRDPHQLGMVHALIEARIPFDVVHERFLDPQDIDRYKLLILPNIACLSEEQCGRLQAFVERGGSLLATFQTSRFDETGRDRARFGLSDLFGVEPDGEVQGPLKNSYLRIEPQGDGAFHPVVQGLEEAVRIINGTHRQPVRSLRRPQAMPLTLIPGYPDLPMEECYPREDHTGICELFLHQHGKGRVVYVPWDIDRSFWEIMHPDHGVLLGNLFRWALNEPPMVEVKGEGVMEVTVWEQPESMTVHLVNLTNPMMFKGPMRRIIASPPQQVQVRVPAGRKVRRVWLPFEDRPATWSLLDQGVHVALPSVMDHEMIAIDLERT